MSSLQTVEDQLAATLLSAADELAHTECLDDEQRGEVYAILEAMRADTEVHRGMVALLAGPLSKQVGNA